MYTEGKWEISGSDIICEDVTIAEDVYTPADAKLISAAPDLLEAAIEVVYSDMYHNRLKTIRTKSESLELLKKAIDKATK